MAEQTGGEKTLPASPHKRQKARDEGRVPRSQDLSSAFALLAALLALRYLGPDIFNRQVAMLAHYIGQAAQLSVGIPESRPFTIEGLLIFAMIVGPIILILMVAGLAVSILQVGFMFSGKPLAPRLEKLNPITGLSNMFNIRSLVELIKSVLKVFLCGYIVWVTLRGKMDDVIALMELTPEGLTPVVGAMAFTLWWRITLAMLVLGLLDYGFQRWQYERDLMMTMQEAREEMREFEGDPRIRQRVRQIQRQLAMQRMMKDVPKADVIITNPTEFAVALRYDPVSMAVPIVVAKGARLLAQRIRDIAVANDVPIIQKPELARTIYRTIDIGQPIPEDLFRTVAEVLAYVYQIDRRVEKRRERQAATAGA
jgi:flagellar biosynthetic protein FlhB